VNRPLDRRTIARSAAVGGIVVFLTLLFDLMVDLLHPHGLWYLLLNDVLIGIVCALIVLVYEQRRRRELAAKLNVIAEMNHRVRNQLEIIQYSAYTTKEKEHMAMIGESVSKIEAALIDILEVGRKKPPRTRTSGAKE
jgi:hypothetical protein